MVSGDILGRPNRVEGGQIGIRNEAQDAFIFGADGARRGERAIDARRVRRLIR
jgi:hypothetical protein